MLQFPHLFFFFFLNDPAPPDISPLPLPAALPFFLDPPAEVAVYELTASGRELEPVLLELGRWGSQQPMTSAGELSVSALLIALETVFDPRSEEHTSELQSQSNLVCRLLLEKKKVI